MEQFERIKKSVVGKFVSFTDEEAAKHHKDIMAGRESINFGDQERYYSKVLRDMSITVHKHFEFRWLSFKKGRNHYVYYTHP